MSETVLVVLQFQIRHKNPTIATICHLMVAWRGTFCTSLTYVVNSIRAQPSTTVIFLVRLSAVMCPLGFTCVMKLRFFYVRDQVVDAWWYLCWQLTYKDVILFENMEGFRVEELFPNRQ